MRKPIIAITGSSGKTTTKEMIASILQTRWRTFKSIENGNDTWFTSQYKKQIKSFHKAVVLEYGMRKKGDIKRHCELIQPKIGVITNVGRAHIGHFQNGLVGIAAAKSELIAGMNSKGVLFLNKDDPHSKRLNLTPFQGKIKTVSTRNKADYRAQHIRYGSTGMTFNVRLDNEVHTFHIPCFGRCNVYNAMFAIGVSHYLGCTVAEIRSGFREMEKPYGRLSITKNHRKMVVINDSFNTKPELDSALDVLNHVGLARGRKIAVLGDIQDLGKHAKTIHLAQGRKLGRKKLDLLYTYGYHSKYLGIGARQSGMSSYQVKHFTKIAELKKTLAMQRKTGDTFLLKGSTNGHPVKLMHLAEWLICCQKVSNRSQKKSDNH
ncbi:UDP-N-acetylmuramoyl-tripeptide--D-alanyl-D-alanine ligase [Paenibacillus illinoisensis]|uniref:UDP-N-acetylmuramoyl-tripeptide--D-alanyl-D- alanine ligase n=1 Tax=Paenibacillus illinoisensis TaxID=59845 RepID=UPI003D2D2633